MCVQAPSVIKPLYLYSLNLLTYTRLHRNYIPQCACMCMCVCVSLKERLCVGCIFRSASESAAVSLGACICVPERVFVCAGAHLLTPSSLCEREGNFCGLSSKHKHQLHVVLEELALGGTAQSLTKHDKLHLTKSCDPVKAAWPQSNVVNTRKFMLCYIQKYCLQ